MIALSRGSGFLDKTRKQSVSHRQIWNFHPLSMADILINTSHFCPIKAWNSFMPLYRKYINECHLRKLVRTINKMLPPSVGSSVRSCRIFTSPSLSAAVTVFLFGGKRSVVSGDSVIVVVMLSFYPECHAADKEQSIPGAAETTGEPEYFSQQPDGGAAETHHLPAGAEFSLTHTDSKASGTQRVCEMMFLLKTRPTLRSSKCNQTAE